MSSNTYELKDYGISATSNTQDFGNADLDSRQQLAKTTKPRSNGSYDEHVLARFGKKQQLKRRFQSLSSIGLTTSLMLTWIAILW
ncbi:hypothetical protein ACMFMG_000204 [Clarireedia jacksonii]